MITVIQGRPGMGKTVFGVSLIEKFTARKQKVFSNIDIDVKKLKRPEFFTYVPHDEVMDTLSNVREGEFVLDEIQTFLNSRKWDVLPLEVQVFLQQHRKRGVNIYGICQSVKRSDVVFRELVQVFYEIRKLFVINVLGFLLGFFWLREFDPDSIESQGRKYDQIGWGKPIILDKVTMSLYDTNQEMVFRPLCSRCKSDKRNKTQCAECGRLY